MEELLIRAGEAESGYWRDLWRYRELFYFLAWRDILVRYKQTVLGVAWALLQPLLTMVVFSVIFGKIGRFPSYGVPYPILVFAGLLPWQFVSRAISESGASLVSQTGLVSKVYFPRVIVPIAAIMVGAVDFLVSFVLLAALMFWYGFAPRPEMAGLLLLLPAAFLVILGPSLWVSALTVRYRDFRYVVPFFLQLGLYISPVAFSSSIVPERFRLVYSINPAAPLIDGFRWAILGDARQIYLPGVAAGAVVTAVLILSGLWYFRRTERTFADVI